MSKSIRSLGFVAAMEDDAPEVEINIDQGVPAEVEAQAAEVAEDVGEVDSETQAMEDAVADADVLDAIADSAESSVEQGEGMDPVAAEIAEVAVEAIYERLGIQRKAIPSMESFGSSGSRKSATRIAVEDWKEQAKKVWAAVVNFFKNLWEKIKVLFEKFLNFFRSLEKAAESMKKRVEGLKGEAKEKEFENASLAKALGAGTGKASASTAKEVLKKSQESGDKMVILGNSCYAAVDMIKSFAASANLTKDEAVAKLEEIKKKNSLDEKNTLVDHLFNNTSVHIESKDGKASVVVKEEEGTSGSKVETLSKSEMLEICTAVISLSKSVAGTKKIADASNKMYKSVAGVANSVGSTASKEESDKAAVMKHMAKEMVAYGAVLTKISTTIPNLATKAGKAGLSYVDASMKQYSEKKEEAKKD